MSNKANWEPTCPTVKVKSTHPPSQGEFVEIDAHTFDPSKHERYEPEAAAKAAAEAQAKLDAEVTMAPPPPPVSVPPPPPVA